MSLVSTLKRMVSGNHLALEQGIAEERRSGRPRKLWNEENLSEAFKVHVNCVATSKQPILFWEDGGTDLSHFAERVHRKSPFAKHQFAVVSCRVNPLETWCKALAQFFASHQTPENTGSVSESIFPPGGTVFFDELEFLPQELQHLLYAQLDHEGMIRFMDRNARGVEVRIMASSTMDIWRKCQEGVFHADLFCQMNRLTVHCQSTAGTLADSSKKDGSVSPAYAAELQ